MALTQNQIGEIGEAIFKVRILQDGLIDDVFFMGEKAKACDFMCSFADNNTTYNFLVQVKATITGYNKTNRNLKVRINKTTIDRLESNIIPTYIAGVDIIDEKVYLWGVFSQQTNIPSLPINYMLEMHNPNNVNIINRLKEDVIRYWTNHNPQPKLTYQSLMV